MDTDDHSKERVALSGMYSHVMQMVIIQNPVIYPFTGSTVIVNLLIFIRTSGHRSIEPDVPVRFRVDTTAIGGCRTFLFSGTGRRFAADKRAAPFAGMLLFTVPPVDHAEPGHAQRCAVCVNRDGVRNGIRPSPVRVQVDKRADVPFLAKPISGIIVMCRAKAEVSDRDIRIHGFKFPEGDDGADAVVFPGIQKTDMQGQVNADLCIVGAEHIKCMSKIEGFFVAVPSPVSIRIGKMAFTGAMENAVFHAFADFMAIRKCVGMDTGAIAGKGDTICRDKPVSEGRIAVRRKTCWSLSS